MYKARFIHIELALYTTKINTCFRVDVFCYMLTFSYDPRYMYPKKDSPLDPNTIMRHGTASSSEGYANLFSSLCR